MSVERLRLINFQRHADRKVTLAPGLNVITGPSDAGKSALLRALRYLFLNSLRGDFFITHGADTAKVSAKVDGATVSRSKGRSNEYRLNDKVFKAFRGDVPPEIAAFVSVSEVNFARQGDPPFWLCETPQSLAREFNKVVDLELIDSSLSKLALAKRRAKESLMVAKTRLEEAETASSKTQYLELLKLTVDKLRSASKSLDESKAKHRRLSSLLDAALRSKRSLKSTQRRREAFAPVERLCAEVSALEDTKSRARRLSSLIALCEGERVKWRGAAEIGKSVTRQIEDLIGRGTVCPLCQNQA